MTLLETRFYRSETDENTRYRVELFQDTDAENPLSYDEEFQVFSIRGGYFSTFDIAIADVASDVRELVERFTGRRKSVGEIADILNRFMRITGDSRRFHGETMRGYSQSDWQDLIVWTDTEFDSYMPNVLESVWQWAIGDVYGISLATLTTCEHGGETERYEDSLWGIYADSYDEAINHFVTNYAPVEIAQDVANWNKYTTE